MDLFQNIVLRQSAMPDLTLINQSQLTKSPRHKTNVYVQNIAYNTLYTLSAVKLLQLFILCDDEIVNNARDKDQSVSKFVSLSVHWNSTNYCRSFQTVFLYCYSDCPSCLAHLINTNWST